MPSTDSSCRQSQWLVVTETTEHQEETELECQPFFIDLASLPRSQLDHLRQVGLLLLPEHVVQSNNNSDDDLDICLLYDHHAAYLQRVFSPEEPLASSFVSLDASHPWMLYWCLHACDLIDRLPTTEILLDVVHYLETCWQSTTVQLPPHLLPQLVAKDGTLQQQQQQQLEIAAAAASATQQQEVNHTDSPFASNLHSNLLAVIGGGFGGGPGQMAHCATTYASVLTLCIIATTDDDNAASQAAWNLLERIRVPLTMWFLSLQQPSSQRNDVPGGYSMHLDGEVDVRAAYTVLCCVKLLGLTSITFALQLGLAEFCAACQTYEGGFGSEPDSEAHGGFTFCAMAVLQWLLAAESSSTAPKTSLFDAVNITSLRDWLSRRQMPYEGGFSGRTNKLVDGCYSFWQGSSVGILEYWLILLRKSNSKQSEQDGGSVENDNTAALPAIGDEQDPWIRAWQQQLASFISTFASSDTPPSARPHLLMDEGMLQRYILLCAQETHGGLRDKPSKARDFYHSCYNLSGLSVTQQPTEPLPTPFLWGQNEDEARRHSPPSRHHRRIFFGHAQYSQVAAIHPCYNIRIERVNQVLLHFRNFPPGVPPASINAAAI